MDLMKLRNDHDEVVHYEIIGDIRTTFKMNRATYEPEPYQFPLIKVQTKHGFILTPHDTRNIDTLFFVLNAQKIMFTVEWDYLYEWCFYV